MLQTDKITALYCRLSQEDMQAGERDVYKRQEQAQRDNPLKTAEQTTEQNGNMIDGLINNTPTAVSYTHLDVYKRQDSSFLTDDMGGTAAGIIALLCEKLPFMAGADFTPDVYKRQAGSGAYCGGVGAVCFREP